jgi:hypothetical protein
VDSLETKHRNLWYKQAQYGRETLGDAYTKDEGQSRSRRVCITDYFVVVPATERGHASVEIRPFH